jgi:hypothetical protein
MVRLSSGGSTGAGGGGDDGGGDGRDELGKRLSSKTISGKESGGSLSTATRSWRDDAVTEGGGAAGGTEALGGASGGMEASLFLGGASTRGRGRGGAAGASCSTSIWMSSEGELSGAGSLSATIGWNGVQLSS